MMRHVWRTAALIVSVSIGASWSAAQPSRRFDVPRERGYRIDVCLTWGTDCGKPAADVFCRRNGFPAAESFEIAENVGAARPTITLGDQRVCNHPECDGFRSITCRAAPQRGSEPATLPRPIFPELRPMPPDPEPSIALLRYLAPRGYDPQFLCWAVVTTGPQKGQRLLTCGSSGGGASIGDIVGGLGGAFVEGVGGLVSLGAPVVNWASSTYNSAKAGAVGAVIDSLRNTVGCGATCQWAVGAAIDAGMMAMGMPPSLPDFDRLVKQLENQGIDALADAAVAAAASQGVTVPREVAKAAVVKLKNAAVAAAASGPGGPARSYVPDPELAYRPAAMLFEAKNVEDSRATAPVTFRVVNGHLQKGSGPYDFMTTGSGGGRFQTANVSVPPLKPRTSVRFVVPLEPLQDPHEWLAMREKAEIALKEAFVHHPCGATPNRLSDRPAYDKWHNCIERYNAEQKAKGQTHSQQLFASNAVRDAWTKTYTTSELGFETWLVKDGSMARGGYLRCPPNASTCAADFAEPAWHGQRVDYCLFFGRDCGQPAANVFCNLMGYARTIDFVPAKGVPTRTLGDHRVCDQPACAGFQRIVCAP